MLRKLGDLELVIQFQQFCGLRWKHKKTGISNGIKSDKNGFTSHVNRKATCNGSVTHSRQDRNSYEYNPCMHLLFHFSSSLGDEQVLIAFLSFIYWNIDPYLVMRVFLCLAISLYFGQSAKDLFRWPRPPSPPVVRVEKKYAEEYSMPSTHAMMGTLVPFSFLYFTHGGYEYQAIPAVLAATICCCLVGASRVYLGMHSVKDVLVGIVFQCVILAVILPWLKELAMEKWCQTSPNALSLAFILPATLLWIYPTSTPTTFNTYSDTAMVLGIVAGSIIGLKYSRDNENLMIAFLGKTFKMSGFSLTWYYIQRFAVGTSLLALTRLVMKRCITTSCAKMVPNSWIMKPVGYQRFVEIPHKFVTYGTVAFNCIYIAPKLFELCGIS